MIWKRLCVDIGTVTLIYISVYLQIPKVHTNKTIDQKSFPLLLLLHFFFQSNNVPFHFIELDPNIYKIYVCYVCFSLIDKRLTQTWFVSKPNAQCVIPPREWERQRQLNNISFLFISNVFPNEFILFFGWWKQFDHMCIR